MRNKLPADGRFLPVHFKSHKSENLSWWAPIWRGLVVEGTAKHYRAMRTAIWLYFYLIIHANRGNGTLFRRIDTIAADMGVNRATVQRWMAKLTSRGYLLSQRTGRALKITILRWKPLQSRSSQSRFNNQKNSRG